MAVILDDSSTPIDMDALTKEMKKQGLPSYARPCFIRLTKKIELTGEFFDPMHSFSIFIRHISRDIQSEKDSLSG